MCTFTYRSNWKLGKYKKFIFIFMCYLVPHRKQNSCDCLTFAGILIMYWIVLSFSSAQLLVLACIATSTVIYFSFIMFDCAFEYNYIFCIYYLTFLYLTFDTIPIIQPWISADTDICYFKNICLFWTYPAPSYVLHLYTFTIQQVGTLEVAVLIYLHLFYIRLSGFTFYTMLILILHILF